MQFQNNNERFVAVREDDGRLYRLRGYDSTCALALQAANSTESLRELVAKARGDAVDEKALVGGGGKTLPPIDHPEPSRMMISGTGLTHLGSAKTRDDMHAKKTDDAPLTDSMRMFRMGVEGGKPAADQFYGAQPEWFYKGDGNNLVSPDDEIIRPAYATDGGEEPEVVGVYIIDNRGMPRRIGFALGNEYSDHVMEKENYLWLAHSKLRQCAIGPELLIGDLPPAVEGTSAIRRGGEIIWQQSFVSGEENMCHSVTNLERHHFKYDVFCTPGTVHLHFFGTATLSFADGVSAQNGDEFVIESPAFGLPLVNRLRLQSAPVLRDVIPL